MMATSGSRCHRSSSRNLLTKVPRWPPPAAAAVIFSLFAIAKYTALRMKKHHKVPWPLFQTAVTVSHTHIGHLDMTPSLPPSSNNTPFIAKSAGQSLERLHMLGIYPPSHLFHYWKDWRCNPILCHLFHLYCGAFSKILKQEASMLNTSPSRAVPYFAKFKSTLPILHLSLKMAIVICHRISVTSAWNQNLK